MDTKALLEQLLESGRKIAEQGLEQGSELAAKGKELAQQGVEYAKGQLPPAGPEREKFLKNLGVGAAAGGLLALLVGTKTGRKVLSPAVKLGSIAALGGIGYKVFQEWQKSQGIEATGQSIVNLAGPEANDRSMAIVKAMIGAAKADGTIDEKEQAIITEQIKNSDLDASVSDILFAELQKPLDVDSIAAAADSPESAVEIYLASLLLADKDNSAEASYLEKLANAMKLDPQLVANLEAQVLAAS